MRKIWKRFIKAGLIKEGAAWLMGNLFAESDIIPIHIETLCLQRVREVNKLYTDATYITFVNDDTISCAKFLHSLSNC